MSVTDTFRFGPFLFDGPRRRLERDGDAVPLQPRVFETLLYLLHHPHRVIPRQELLGALWPGIFVTESVLTRCIKEVRKALGDDARQPRYIRTASRIGYELIVDFQATAVPEETGITIAVLPFAPLVAEERDERLELGMADNLIVRLSGLESVVVRPLSAVRRYSGWEREPLSAGRQLGVSLVVDGCLNRSRDCLRVTTRVLRVSDGRALLCHIFDEESSGFLAVQDALCQRITDTLEIRLTGDESRGLAERSTSHLEAYRYYLLARLNAARNTREDDRRSIALF